MLRLKVHRAAKSDLAEVVSFYAAISQALPDAFLEQFRNALTLLCDRPEVGSRRFAHLFPDIELRTWSLDRFPFRVFYMVKGNTLHVLRLDHERREVTKNSVLRARKKK